MVQKKRSRQEREISLGEKLRRAREQVGLSQWQAAKALRRPQSFISRCETGTQFVSVLDLEDFAELYRVPIQSFFGETN